jgi:hypothetical protein
MRKGIVRVTKVVTWEYHIDLDDKENRDMQFYLGDNQGNPVTGEPSVVCKTIQDCLELDMQSVEVDGDGFIVQTDPVASTTSWTIVDPEGNAITTKVVENIPRREEDDRSGVQEGQPQGLHAAD